MKKVSVNCEQGAKMDWNKRDKWQKQAMDYRCTVKYDGRQYTTDFFMGPAHTDEPDDTHIVPCLLSSYYTYEQSPELDEFANDFGYDLNESYQETKKIYNAVMREGKAAKRLFGNDLDSIQERYNEY